MSRGTSAPPRPVRPRPVRPGGSGGSRRFGPWSLIVCALLATTSADTKLVDGERDAPALPPISLEQFFAPAQDRAEERGCCVLLTPPQPSCAYTSRGYCAARAGEAGIMFEFHEVASCSNVAQCR